MRGISVALTIVMLVVVVLAIVGMAYSFIFQYYDPLTNKLFEVKDTFCSGGTARIVIKNIGTETIETPAIDVNDLGLVFYSRFEDLESEVIDETTNENNLEVKGQTRFVFHLDEEDGTNLRDETNYKRTGTVSSEGMRSDDCQSGGCLSFDGVGDYVEINHVSTEALGDAWTIEAWVKPKKLEGEQAVVSKYYHHGGKIYTYAIILNDNNVELKVTPSGTTNTVTLTSESVLKENEWYHIAGTFKENGKMILYINGFYDTSVDDLKFSASRPGVDTYLGCERIDDNTRTKFFEGVIDEVALHSLELSKEEVERHYKAHRAKFSEWAKGAMGQGFLVNWMDYAFGLVSEVDFSKASGLSAAAWVKTNGPKDQVIFDAHVPGFVGDPQYGLLRTQNSMLKGRFFYQKINPTGPVRYVEYSQQSQSIAPQINSGDKWYHIAFTFDKNARRPTLYIDKKKVDNIHYFQHPTESEYVEYGIISPDSFCIGATNCAGGGLADPFVGMIDTLAVFDRELTEREVWEVAGCSIVEGGYQCGDIEVIKNKGRGDLIPELSKPIIEPGETTVLSDIGCRGKCDYTISTGTMTISTAVVC